MRHANPLSVYTRFLVPPLLALSIWSRMWFGWYSLIGIGAIVIWVYLNPIAFPKPKTTNNWASKGTFGERIWIKKRNLGSPSRHSTIPNWINIFSSLSIPFLVYGLYKFDIWVTVAGVIIMVLGKAWFLDRMVWLYEDVKNTSKEFKNWEY